MGLRIPLNRAVVIYQRGSVWWLDIHQGDRRVRKKLATKDKAKAPVVARDFAATIISGRWNVAQSGIKFAVGPHALRRSFATILARELPAFALQKLLGHSSASTTSSFYVGNGAITKPPK
ncbi:MAG: tyrosine-type recombinase/integrase [Planctomycetes bacterium]|nr:tyrosine-type recombinase/integrase [Planctomycetota bacterium]